MKKSITNIDRRQLRVEVRFWHRKGYVLKAFPTTLNIAYCQLVKWL